MVNQTHLPERALNEYPDVRCVPAVHPNGRAIVFVHGYNGDSLRTWSEFDRLLCEEPTCDNVDLIFYGYDGLHSDLVASASLLRDFLTDLFQRPATLANPSLPPEAARASHFAYTEVVLAAHSLGAVLARWALLSASRQGHRWPKTSKLVLYAPAHTGADVVKLALETAGPFKFLAALGGLVRFASPLIDQLRPDSAHLAQLRTLTSEALQAPGNEHLIAKRVLIAQHERVVSNTTFCSDPEPTSIRGTTHSTVCKPRRDFLDPVRHLLEVWNGPQGT